MAGIALRTCRECGCTESSPCIDKFGQACAWVEDDLCSSCAPDMAMEIAIEQANGVAGYRLQLISAAMQGILANPHCPMMSDPDIVAKAAIANADAVLVALEFK